MEEKDSWSLSEEEIKERLRKLNQERKEKGATRSGRSSNQGVKLLYIRDYLYAHATKEHPKNSNEISKYLASLGIKADRKTIYNDILRLQMDFQEPIEYNPKKWGYYITEPEFDTRDLRILMDCIQYADFITMEESTRLIGKVKEMGSIYDKELFDRPMEAEVKDSKAQRSVFQNIDIITALRLICCLSSLMQHSCAFPFST